MLRAPDAPLSALASPTKAGHGALCSYSYDCEASEERSSDDHYDFQRQSVKIATAGSRSLGLVIPSSAACRTPSRSVCAPWVPAFLAATYFQPCERHKHHKKNECTFFCITCGAKPNSVCQHCMGAHAGHQVIQVRRYVYCDVVRTCDITSYVDTTGVQNYIINSAKVMFLNHRPHTKIGRANGVDVCRTCQRHLREGYSYCSLACKVEALTKGDAPASAATATTTGPSTYVSPTSAAPCRTTGSGLQKAASDAATICISPRARSLSAAASVLPSPPAGAAAAAAPSPRSGIRASGGLTATAATAAAAVALLSADVGGAAAAGSCAAGGLSSDPESSDPGDDTILYGTSRSAVDGGLAAAAAGRRRSVFARDRRDPYGSASSEDDCCEYNFENPPKRRRSSLIGRRPSNSSSIQDPQPPSAADLAAAATAAATLLLPFRNLSGSLPLSVSPASASATGPVSSGPEPAAAEPDLRGVPSLTAAVAGPAAAAAAIVVPVSRRKQNAPQRAPSC